MRAAEAGIDRLLTVGKLSAAAGESFRGEHRHFDARNRLVDFLMGHLNAEDSLLVKGSRSARLDELVDELRQSEAPC